MSDNIGFKTNKTEPVAITKLIEKGELPRDIARAVDHLWHFVVDNLEENGDEDAVIDMIRVHCGGDLLVTFTPKK